MLGVYIAYFGNYNVAKVTMLKQNGNIVIMTACMVDKRTATRNVFSIQVMCGPSETEA